MPSLAVPSQPPGSVSGGGPADAAVMAPPVPLGSPAGRAAAGLPGDSPVRDGPPGRPAGPPPPAAPQLPDNGPPGGGPPGDGPSGDHGWGWDGDDWDPAGSLTAQEIAALTALDRADGLAGDWDEDPGGVPPADAGGWAAGPRPLDREPLDGGAPDGGSRDGEPADGEPSSRPGCAPVEVLPGLLPRRLGSGGGFDAGGGADRVPPGPVLAGLAGDRWAGGLGRVSDDELAGLMIAWRRIASWAAPGSSPRLASCRGAARCRQRRLRTRTWASTWPMRSRWCCG